MADYFESGFFVRQEAWHGMGHVVQTPPGNAVDACQKAGLDWDVAKLPLFFTHGGQEIPTKYYAIVREGDNKVFGQCTREYHPLQNFDAMEWCEPLLDTELWTYETAGSLKEGQVCWVLLKQDETQIVPNDVFKRYLLFTWNHSGRQASTIRPVSIRVVCANTLRAAMGEEGQDSIRRVWHTSEQWRRLEEIRKFYKMTSLEFARQQDIFRRFADVTWNDSQLEFFVEKAVPMPEEEGGRKLTIFQKHRDALAEMVVDGKASGAKQLGIKNTAYGAFMAATEFYEHYYGGGRVKDRGTNILYGTGCRIMDNIFETTCSLANVSLPSDN